MSDGRGGTRDYDWDVALPWGEVFESAGRVLRAKGMAVFFLQNTATNNLLQSFRVIKGGLSFCYRLEWLKEHFTNPLSANKIPVSYIEDILVFSKGYSLPQAHPLREYSRKVVAYAGKTQAEVKRILGNKRAQHFWSSDSVQFSLCTKETYAALTAVLVLRSMPGFLEYEELQGMLGRSKGERVFNLPFGESHKPNVLFCRRDLTGFHPTQKPLALLEDLVLTYSNPGDLVLDFTMGSGSTGVACKNLGRRFIGIEKELRFFEQAQHRIAHEGRQLSIFENPLQPIYRLLK